MDERMMQLSSAKVMTFLDHDDMCHLSQSLRANHVNNFAQILRECLLTNGVH